MPVFYHSRRIRITGHHFEVLLPSYQAFVIGDIESAWIVIWPAGWPRSVVRISCSSGLAAVTFVIAHPERPTPLGSVLAVVLLGIAARLVAQPGDRTWRRHPRQELWVTYRSRSVRLFVSEDSLEFGGVRRALQRAREWSGDTGG